MTNRILSCRFFGLCFGLRFGLLLGLCFGLCVGSGSAMASAATGVQEDATSEATETAPLLVAGQTMTVDLDSHHISLTLETERPESGVPIILRLTVVGETGQSLELPRPGEVLGRFEVLDDRRRSNPTASGSSRQPPSFTLRTFDAGRLELPPITIRLGTASVTFPSRTIEVASVAGLDAGPEQFRDISDPVKVKAPIDWWFVSLVVTGSIATLAILAFFWWRARRPGSPAPPEPADRWALSALEQLASRRLPYAGEIEPFFTELTDIARDFIERRFHIAAPERTTQEFITEAGSHPELTVDQARRLAKLLRAADLVKFAGDRPMVTECDRALEITREFVVEAGPRIEHETSPQRDAIDPPRSPRSGHVNARASAIHRAVDGLDDLEDRS
ncbi:MAG: hypothetical protein OSA40_02560 [Phycisphaerales bacterium]|nr:hypothetical protein [Phycisphaerales bacterium]